MRRAGGAVAAAGVVAALALAATATAHSGLASSSPRHGATLERVPATVTLTFHQALARVEGVRVTRNGRGDLVRSARLHPRDARRVVVTLRRPGPRADGGRYRAAWRVTAADGHAVRGVVAFRVR